SQSWQRSQRGSLRSLLSLRPLRRSESIRRRELELPAWEDVGPAGVLAEPGIADQPDVAGGEQVLVVEDVERVGTNLDPVRSHRKGSRQGHIRVADEVAACRVPPSRLARLASARAAAAGQSTAGRVAAIPDRVRAAALIVRDPAQPPSAHD